MVLIDKLQTARSIDYTRQSFKTPFASIFGRNMTPSTCTINSSAGTDNSSGFGGFWFWSDSRSPLGWWCVEFGRGYWHCGVDSWVSRGCPEPPGNYAMPCSHCSFKIGMGIGAKHRARCRCTLPITVWILAMLLQAQLMVTEDGMEFRWHKAILGGFAPHFGHSLKPSRLRLLAQLRKHFAP